METYKLNSKVDDEIQQFVKSCLYTKPKPFKIELTCEFPEGFKGGPNMEILACKYMAWDLGAEDELRDKHTTYEVDRTNGVTFVMTRTYTEKTPVKF